MGCDEVVSIWKDLRRIFYCRRRAVGEQLTEQHFFHWLLYGQKEKFKLKISKKKRDLGGFQSPEVRENKAVERAKFIYVVFSGTYRRRIQDLHFISGLYSQA